jgi:N-acetylglucosaminyl-diphospho-decaprenol L-rhamnosyltransferase
MKDPAARPEITVVVVNWNGGEHVRRCLDSLFAHPPSCAFDVIVVDNDSRDGSADAIERDARRPDRAGRVSVVRTGENLGFGRANNVAFGMTRSPFALLLNPDTEVAFGAIDMLLQTLRDRPSAGGVGPKLVDADGVTQPSVWHNPPAPIHLLLDGIGLHRFIPARFRGELLLGRHWAHDRFRSVPMLGAAAMLVRREVIDVTGGFDESFHMYGEDNDWCARITRAGFDLLFQPAAVVTHLGGRSSEQRWTAVEKRRVQLEAHFRFQRRYRSRARVALSDATVCFTLAVARVWWSLTGRDRTTIDVTFAEHARDLERTLFGRR